MSIFSIFAKIMRDQEDELREIGRRGIENDRVAHEADRARNFRGKAMLAQVESIGLNNKIHSANSEIQVLRSQLAKSQAETKRLVKIIEDYAVAAGVMKSVIEDLRSNETVLKGLDERAFASHMDDEVAKALPDPEARKKGAGHAKFLIEGDLIMNPDGGFYFEYPHSV